MKLYVACHNQIPYFWEMFRRQSPVNAMFMTPYIFTSETSAEDFVLNFIYKVFERHKSNGLFAAEMKEFNDLIAKDPFSSQTLLNPLIKTLLMFEIKIFEIESDQFI